jgi:transcriptional regulator with XRE-family HTH domain
MAAFREHVQNVRMAKSERQLGKTYIADWRAAAGMSLEALAEEIGKSHATLSRIENRKQPYSQPILEAIAEVFDCLPEDLLSGPPPDREKLWRANRLRQAMQLFLKLPDARQDRVVDDVIDAARLEGVQAPDLALLGPDAPKP